MWQEPWRSVGEVSHVLEKCWKREGRTLSFLTTLVEMWPMLFCRYMSRRPAFGERDIKRCGLISLNSFALLCLLLLLSLLETSFGLFLDLPYGIGSRSSSLQQAFVLASARAFETLTWDL